MSGQTYLCETCGLVIEWISENMWVDLKGYTGGKTYPEHKHKPRSEK